MKFTRSSVFVICCLSFALPALAHEHKLSAEEQKMMDDMKAATTPGEAHKVLEPLAGKWTYTATFKVGPFDDEEKMSGTSVNEMIFGGRFLKQEMHGAWQGETFDGIGYLGYDNVRGEYVATYMDGTQTGIMTETGKYDEATKTLACAGSNSCPMTGEKNRKGRSETTFVDADHYTYAAYGPGPDGKEFKMMEIRFTRAK